MIINESSYKTFSHTKVNGKEAAVILPNKETVEIEVESEDKKTVIFDLEALDCNNHYKIVLRKSAELIFAIVQNGREVETLLKKIEIEIEENAKAEVLVYELGGKFSATELKCALRGKGSEISVNGIYFGYGENELDYSYHVRHIGEDTKSNIHIDGALRDCAKKLVKSNLDFEEGSKRAIGEEEETTVLLSDTVVNKSVPILLSHEDDVQGNHAASSGKIDESLLFYLMTRGLTEESAKSLILMGKFEDTLSRLPDEELREKIREKIQEIVRL